MVARDDIEPGTLLLAEKAVVADMVQGSRETFGQSSTDFSGVLAKAVSVLSKNIATFGKILDLCCKTTAPDDKESGTDNTELCLDVPMILNIIETNVFVVRARKQGIKHSLLYYSASFVNHSCVPNCSVYIYNDVILIRTATLIKKGEEISVAYQVNLEPRLANLPVRGFICNCAYCELERRDSKKLKMKRTELLESASSTKGTFGSNGLLQSIVSSLEESYGRRKKYRTALFHPYLYLAESQNVLSRDFESRFMHFVNKALNCLSLSTQNLLRCSEDRNAHLPRDALLTDEDLLYEAAMRIMYIQRQSTERKRWLDVLLMLERTFAGGDLRMLLIKFPEAELALQ